MFDKIYNNIYYIGLIAGKYFKRFFLWLGRTVSKPIKALSAVLIAAFFVVDKFVLKAFKGIGSEAKVFIADVKRVFSDIKQLFKKDRKKARIQFQNYAKKAVSRHGTLFSFAVNLIVPVLAFICLIMSVNYWKNATLALEIKYNGSVIGYASNESIFLDAQDQAKARLATAKSANSTKQSLIKPAQYQLKVVKKTDLTDSTVICDKLIENSDSKITNACGIYVDGSFLCAVKNETDATSVFDKILTDYKTDDLNAVTSFVEDIAYEQGLYPDNVETVWDADKLSQKLHSKKTEAVYYSVQAGDTPSGIANSHGLTTAEFYNLNPGISESIHIGDKVLISSEVNYVRVQVTKTESYKETLKYTSTSVNNANIYKGTKRVTTKGVNGEQLVTELVTYIDGVRVSSKEVSRVTTVEPVDEVIQVGTKTYSYGGTAVSYGGRFIWPAIGATTISSGYYRESGAFHGGIDMIRPGGRSTGLTIVAAADGIVTTATYHPSWGYYIVINHGGGLSTLYAHTLQGSFKVRVGQRVSAGQPIANIGSTGNVTGPHLHFEVLVNGRRTNPMPYLR